METIHFDNKSPCNTDLKEPLFLRYSVFEDDIAAFKDESSPNLLSTAASSLSSLTIDDDEYCDSKKPYKAKLIKVKFNGIDLNKTKTMIVQEHWRQDPIGSSSESQLSKLTDINEMVKNQTNKSLTNFIDKQEYSHSFISSCSCSEDYKKKSIFTGCNVNECNFNMIVKHNMQNMLNVVGKAEDSIEESFSKAKIKYQGRKGNLKNIYLDNEILFNSYENEFNICNKIGQSKEYTKKNLSDDKFVCDSFRHNKTCHPIDEIYKLNAYEEQLLDQCIRKGMAKVTKQNICDIKPFCWDWNQICLTTRAMLKTNDKSIVKD